jgi:hypothetical protein
MARLYPEAEEDRKRKEEPIAECAMPATLTIHVLMQASSSDPLAS